VFVVWVIDGRVFRFRESRTELVRWMLNRMGLGMELSSWSQENFWCLPSSPRVPLFPVSLFALEAAVLTCRLMKKRILRGLVKYSILFKMATHSLFSTIFSDLITLNPQNDFFYLQLGPRMLVWRDVETAIMYLEEEVFACLER